MKRFISPIILLCLLIPASIVIISGCLQNKNPLGSDYEIRVIADSTIMVKAEPLLKDIFEIIDYNPQPEKAFEIIKGDPNSSKRFKNLGPTGVFVFLWCVNEEVPDWEDR